MKTKLLRTALLSLLSILSFTIFAEQIKDVSPSQLMSADQQEVLILDVRSAEEYASGHVPNAINIPHSEIANHLERLMEYKDKPVVLYCRSGFRAAKAGNVLLENGFSEVQHLQGDMPGWETSGNPIEQ